MRRSKLNHRHKIRLLDFLKQGNESSKLRQVIGQISDKFITIKKKLIFLLQLKQEIHQQDFIIKHNNFNTLFYKIKHQLRLPKPLNPSNPQLSFIHLSTIQQKLSIILKQVIKMQTFGTQVDEQQKAKKVQQKIKLMMKYKKMQKLTSQKDLNSQKPLSTFNDKTSLKFDQISIKSKKNALYQNSYKQQQTFQTYSSKRIKSINQGDDIIPSMSFNLKDTNKKFILSNKQRKGLYQTNTLKKIPSAQKLQSNQQPNIGSMKKLKRPSSVINKSTRATSSRSRKQKPLQLQDKKQMQQKIRQIIPQCFDHGIKLQKYSDEKGLDLNKEYQILFNEQINILRLINNSVKYYSSKMQNQQEQQTKLANGVEKEIIEMLKKKKQKQSVINKCDLITDQIAKLIDARLSTLNKTKVTSL